MEKTMQEKAVELLSENEYKKYNDFIKGYVTGTELKSEFNITREILYLAFKDIDPLTIKKREEHQKKLQIAFVEKINRCIPFEAMNIDLEGLLGKAYMSEQHTVSELKGKVRNKLINSGFELDTKGFQFALQSSIDIWYRDYFVKKELEIGKETPYEIAKKYGIIPRKIYGYVKFFEENKDEDRFIKRIPIEQQRVFEENIKIFQEYENGKRVKDIAQQYKIDPILVNEVISSLKVAKEKLN